MPLSECWHRHRSGPRPFHFLHQRSRLSGGRNIRVSFAVSEGITVPLHGFIKKSRVTPEKKRKLADRRRRDHERNG